jgi:Plasmid replication region DNA-binding N-term
MTFDDVKAAAAALEAQELTPSANKILQHLGVGSKHTVLKFMRQLAPAPAPVPVVPPVAASAVEPWQRPYRPPAAAPVAPETANGHRYPPVPTVPPDPVPHAMAALEGAELVLDASRADMQHTACALALAKGLIHENQRYCHLEPQDPAAIAAVTDAEATTAAYRRAWAAYVDAKAVLAQAQAQALRVRQEEWVHLHQPAVKAEVDTWYTALMSATSDRAHYVAKMEYQKAQFAYQRALAEAPVNGTGA